MSSIKLASEVNAAPDLTPSFKSLLGLSALIFFIADVQGGVGPFLAIYFQSELQWDAGKIGIALAAMNVAVLISQVPSGYLVDMLKIKRLLIVVSCLSIIIGCFFILSFQSLIPIILAQSLIGAASALVPCCITAITIGMVKRSRFPKRTSINEFYNHIGNLATALITGITAQWLGHAWILYVVMIFSIASIISLLLINPKEIDQSAARELPEVTGSTKTDAPISLKIWLTNKTLIIFSISVILFHFSNAAQLPLVGEVLAKKNPQSDSMFMAGSIILAQMVMAVVAFSLGFIMNHCGRKPIFMFAFIVLAIRALLYISTNNPYLFLAIQLLDGLGAGIFGVISVVTISDIAKSTGRFNFTVGLIAACTSIGAAISNLGAGFIAKIFGFNGGLMSLACIAIIGLIFYGLFMPETKNH